MTVLTSPGSPAILRRAKASTNHQDRITWPKYAAATATVERERRLLELISEPRLTRAALVKAFLQAPLHQAGYRSGIGTLYSAVYQPVASGVDFHWPNRTLKLSLSKFREHKVTVLLNESASG
jgi:predicted choloylglycine hydrolase